MNNTAPSPALIPWGGWGWESRLCSSIGAECEGNTDNISAREVSVGLISGVQQFSGGGPKTHRNQPGDGAAAPLRKCLQAQVQGWQTLAMVRNGVVLVSAGDSDHVLSGMQHPTAQNL